MIANFGRDGIFHLNKVICGCLEGGVRIKNLAQLLVHVGAAHNNYPSVHEGDSEDLVLCEGTRAISGTGSETRAYFAGIRQTLW